MSLVRNRDMSWPEEMSSLANNRSLREKLNLGWNKQQKPLFIILGFVSLFLMVF